ncbi:hypothetical protein APHAL10511_000872, partial [Amanita phalloides]
MNAARLTSRAAAHCRTRLFSPLACQVHTEAVHVSHPPPPLHDVHGKNRYTL